MTEFSGHEQKKQITNSPAKEATQERRKGSTGRRMGKYGCHELNNDQITASRL